MASKKDILYMTTNRAMPGWVKIGVTSGGKDGLEERLRALSGTSVPKPFKRWRAVRIEVAPAIEKAIKVVFKEQKVKNREFYEVPTESAEALLEIVVLCGGEEIRRDEIGGSSDAGGPPNYQSTSRSSSGELRVALNGKNYTGTQTQKFIAVIRDIGPERVYDACREGNITHQGSFIVMKTHELDSSTKARGAWRRIDGEYELNTLSSKERKFQQLEKIRSVLGIDLTVEIR